MISTVPEIKCEMHNYAKSSQNIVFVDGQNGLN